MSLLQFVMKFPIFIMSASTNGLRGVRKRAEEWLTFVACSILSDHHTFSPVVLDHSVVFGEEQGGVHHARDMGAAEAEPWLGLAILLLGKGPSCASPLVGEIGMEGGGVGSRRHHQGQEDPRRAVRGDHHVGRGHQDQDTCQCIRIGMADDTVYILYQIIIMLSVFSKMVTVVVSQI